MKFSILMAIVISYFDYQPVPLGESAGPLGMSSGDPELSRSAFSEAERGVGSFTL